MRNKVVVDSCVFSKQFLQEHDSNQANALMNRLVRNKVEILVPRLFIYEVLATVDTGHYSVTEVYKLIMKLQKSLLNTVELNEAYLNTIIGICKAGHVKSGFPSFYDASYHALAIVNDCYFITADKRHFAKTSQLGNIVLLNDWESITFFK